MHASTLRISVILVSSPNRGEDSVWETLASFPQSSTVPREVIVVDVAAPEREARYRREFPWVTLLGTSERVTIPEGRNLAVAVSRGEVLAFVDDHIRFLRDYLEVLLDAFAKGADVVGGSVANANSGTSGSWAHYFAEYSKWLAGIPKPDTADLPGSNWAMRRSLYDELGGFEAGAFGLESELLRRLAAAGRRIVHEPALVIGHVYERNIVEFWPISFRYGLAYGSSLRLPRWKHLLRAMAFPLIAATLLARSYEKAAQTAEYRRKFWKVSLQLTATFAVRAMGEACGSLRRALADRS
ncbi:MAG: glycosyltransferase [Bryobacteraceae bacterium]